ncbi:hypothetical protein IM774_04895 [Erysipelotrichaceae bacterium RD49]|nr:hypothetical protein [Erysipelotrichaceae bacterium RD49]
MYDELFEYELIQKIAAPILDKLLEMQEQVDSDNFDCPVTIQLSTPDLEIQGYEAENTWSSLPIDAHFLEKLEIYLQEQIDVWNRPTTILQ